MSKNKKQNSTSEDKQPSFPQVPGFSSQFKSDLQWWFKNDKKRAEKILDLVTEVMRNPFQGIGKPEPLKYMEGNIWSRRIDLEHRLIYRISATQIDFLACRFHYDNL
ncbi:Txe/YoeB family addiction module toxin [Cyanobacterium aponinum]|uniref:Endoribonuclease YoeB n=1 Tax=Cyanobacterium aponinum (strain PCC 10605) TaxID=755178 RepID=K9Z287_CYAAP|nr:Txe/YoeB family addiction module toxin [Cyanobacterium aponinum]AFZ53316.1 addiction module toxin, Txe/YoeB family [Cyanobacterium aponinum PCC 10605]